jgi:omega-6 fatty acid desaturase (delta-12 desaturase)
LIVAVLIWLIGIKAFLIVHLPIMMLAAWQVWRSMCSINLNTRWDRDGTWCLHARGLHGSSL